MCILLLVLNIQTSLPDTQSCITKRIELGLNDPSSQDYYLIDTGRRMTIIILVFLNNNPDYSKKILKSNVQIGCDLIFNIIMSNYFDNIAWYNLKAKTLNNPDTCSLIKRECVNNMEEYYRLYVLGGEQDRISCMVEYITSEICTKLDENEIVSDFRNYVRRSSSHFVFKLMREYNGNEIEYVYVAKPSAEDSCTGMEKSIDEAYVVTNYTDLHKYLQELSDEGSRTKVFLENNFLYIFISKIVIQVCKVQSDKKTRLISPTMFKNLLLSETKTFLCDILQKQFYNTKNLQPIYNFDILFCFRMREEDMCMLLNLVRNYKMPESDKMMIGELLSQAISFTTRLLIYSHCKFFVPELCCCDTLIERLSGLEWHNIDSFVAYFDAEFCNKKDMKAKLCRSYVCLGEDDDFGKFDATKMQLTMVHGIRSSLIF